jgi:hypothetical protein
MGFLKCSICRCFSSFSHRILVINEIRDRRTNKRHFCLLGGRMYNICILHDATRDEVNHVHYITQLELSYFGFLQVVM